MKWRRIAIAPTGHLNGLRCGKTKLYFGSVFYNSNKNMITKKDKKNGIPQAERFLSHGTFLEPQRLLETKAIFGHCDQFGVGDGRNRVECMLSATRQPRHFDSELSIAKSMQNGPL